MRSDALFVVCRGCTLVGGANTVQIGDSIDSGIVDSLVSHGHLPNGGGVDGVRIGDSAVRPLDQGTVALPCVVAFPAGSEGRFCPTANAAVQPAMNPEGSDGSDTQ